MEEQLYELDKPITLKLAPETAGRLFDILERLAWTCEGPPYDFPQKTKEYEKVDFVYELVSNSDEEFKQLLFEIKRQTGFELGTRFKFTTCHPECATSWPPTETNKFTDTTF